MLLRDRNIPECQTLLTAFALCNLPLLKFLAAPLRLAVYIIQNKTEMKQTLEENKSSDAVHDVIDDVKNMEDLPMDSELQVREKVFPSAFFDLPIT